MLIVGLLLLTMTPAACVLTLGFIGRQANATASRASCYRSAPRNVALINETRVDAQSAQDAEVDASGAMLSIDMQLYSRDLDLIGVLDQQTDVSSAPLLINAHDRAAVEGKLPGTKPFTCQAAFPNARLIP
jgi:hypothetical protein